MNKDELEQRRDIIAACLWMNSSGLNQGTSGNISVRYGDTMLISPSGVPYEQLEPEDIVAMTLTGEYGSYEAKGNNIPSSEWRFHLDIMRARPDVGAIVHTHSLYATTLGCCRKDIPAVHYMIAASGGPNIRCSAYATYGTAELSTVALAALEDRTCCILANHGMIATGPTLAKAQWLAVELETIAKQYYLTLCIGGPVCCRTTRSTGSRSGSRATGRGPRPKPPTRTEERPSARRRRAEAAVEPFDLVVVGGGVNGAGIARDAAGRGLKVLLCEKDDLAQGTSSRSGKLVHGGLRYLEYYEFRLVREALIEREVLLRAAPHIIWPMRFVLPHVAAMRPAWLVRLGLFLYDHLGGRKLLPPTRALNCAAIPKGGRSSPNTPRVSSTPTAGSTMPASWC